MANGPILELSGQEVKFSVEKATNDIHISISAENPLTEASWEIVLGKLFSRTHHFAIF
jgi:hypothetical protein